MAATLPAWKSAAATRSSSSTPAPACGRSASRLLAEFKNQPLNLTLLLTHTHWDHIQGLPFFGPIYDSRCRLRILGCEGARKGLVSALTGQMESTYFPVPFDKLPSNIEIEELKKFNFNIGAGAGAGATRAIIPACASATGCSRPTARWPIFPTPNRARAARTGK